MKTTKSIRVMDHDKSAFNRGPYTLDKIKGIGPKRLTLLEELNIHTVEDLVLYLPTRYEDNTVIDLNQAEDQSTVTVQGEVYSTPAVAFW